MGLLRGYDSFIGEAAGAALSLFIENSDAGAIGTQNAVGQIRRQFGLKFDATVAAETAFRQGFGATMRAEHQFQVIAAVGA
jgi:hypothetical protein